MKHVMSLEALVVARDKILDAERALDAALLSMDSAPRADKVVVSDAVGEAFEKLRSARAILTDIEQRSLALKA